MKAVVVRAPLRLALGGGGTDLPAYFRRNSGFAVSAAIARYVYVTAAPSIDGRFHLKHLTIEEVVSPRSVRHPLLRALLDLHWDDQPLELASVAEVPPGTGLGSSGAFTVCALKALGELHAARQEQRDSGWEEREPPARDPQRLAEQACHVEIDVVGRSVGKHDQYAAAFGGVRAYEFLTDGSVSVRTLDLHERSRRALVEETGLFFLGGRRSASRLLAGVARAVRRGDRGALVLLHRAREIAEGVADALERGDVETWARLLDAQWDLKRRRAPGAVPPRADELRAIAQRAGAAAVALMGAGGGGFLLCYAPEALERVRQAMRSARVHELPFALDHEGCRALETPVTVPSSSAGDYR